MHDHQQQPGNVREPTSYQHVPCHGARAATSDDSSKIVNERIEEVSPDARTGGALCAYRQQTGPHTS